MRRIDSSTKAVDKFGPGRHGFQQGVPGVSQATALTADFFNELQEELAGVIEGEGIALEPGNLGQLRAAIQSMLAGTVTPVTGSGTLSASQCRGLILIDASAGDVTLTLPATGGALGVRDVAFRRVDSSVNKVILQAAGADRMMHNVHLSGTGYAKYMLFGAGDWCHWRGDTAGHWWLMGRLDGTPIGRPMPDSSVVVPPGGWLPGGSLLLSRTELPWLWDHAQQSGAIVADAGRTEAQGAMWTTGDGATTFRTIDLRGEFIRALDEARGVDVGRALSSWQGGEIQSHSHTVNIGGGNVSYAGAGGNPVAQREAASYPVNAAGGTETRPRNVALPYRLKLI